VAGGVGIVIILLGAVIFLKISNPLLARLAENEQRFRGIFEQAAVGLAQSSPDGHFFIVNQRFCDIVGHPRSAVLGHTFREITHPDDLEWTVAHVQQLLAGEVQNLSIEKRYIRQDGATVWGNLTISLVRERSGEPKYMIAIVEDISERKQIEAALQDSNAFNQATLNSLTANITVLDKTGKIITTNQAWQHFARENGDQILEQTDIGADYLEVCRRASDDDADARLALAGIQAVLAGEQDEFLLEYPCHSPEVNRWFVMRVTPLHDGSGGVVVAHENITTRRQAEDTLRENERRLATLMGNLPGMVYRCFNDPLWTMAFVSEGCLALTGYQASALEGNKELPYSDIIHPDYREQVWQQVQAALAGRQPFQLTYQIRAASGKEKWVLEHGEGVFTSEGEVATIEGFIADITERKVAEETLQQTLHETRIAYEQAIIYSQELNKEIIERKRVEKLLRNAHDELEIRVLGRTMDLSKTNEALQLEIKERERIEEALRKSEERYILAAQGANDGLWDWNMQNNQVYYSPRWKAMLGYEELEISDSPEEWLDRVHPVDKPALKLTMEAHLTGQFSHFEHEHRVQHRDGNFRWMLTRGLAIRDDNGQVLRMAGSQTDITGHKRIEEKLAYDARHDSLTTLPNRAYFLDQVKHAIGLAQKNKDHRFAVLFLDLDRFKLINDSLGHMIGDELLMATSARLILSLDSTAVVARLGGDEFAILLNGIKTIDAAIEAANRIQQQIGQPFEVSNKTVFTTVSIGIAPSISNYDQAEDYLRAADTAMYQAKRNGRARHELFQSDMYTSALSLWQLDTDLRQAVERDEFQIYYQPIISLATGQIIGAEALVRWRHPRKGLLEPRAFMPQLEETGLIVPIGEQVLQTVLAQIKVWHSAGLSPLSIAVNLSARQFQYQNLPNLIQSLLQEAGLPPEVLVIEVTESVATKGMETSLASLLELSDMGIKISIDDFGIGSALDCLKRLPLNHLKIDRSFVKDIFKEPANAAITKAIIDLAHDLDLIVIAEGVETAAQLSFLQAHRCDQIQGYLFSRPMPAQEFSTLLEQDWHLTGDNVSSQKSR
jgi:diguanylate cyclase (GGDEF)-like protein/PAS domain S-box-containing protein